MKNNSKVTKLSNINQNDINNCFAFYNQYFKNPFTLEQQNTLTEKILSILKYDYMLALQNGQKLPQYCLTIIYFICEYKKAYTLSSNEEKAKRVDTHEAIGQRNEYRQELLSELLKTSEDKTKTKSTRTVAAIKAYLLEPLVDDSTKKRGWLQFGTAYIFLIWIKRIYEPFLNKTYDDKTIYQLIDEALELFSFTATANSKVSNTLAILLFDILTNKTLQIDSSNAISWTREIVGKYIEEIPIPRDRYRQDNFTKREIYFAGLYNKMPIFQWYIPKNKNRDISYYSEKDLQEILNSTQDIQKNVTGNFMYTYVISSFAKSFGVKYTLFQKNIDEEFSSTDKIYEELKRLHVLYANLPLGLFQYIIIKPLSKIERAIKLISGIYSKFTRFISKFTQK